MLCFLFLYYDYLYSIFLVDYKTNSKIIVDNYDPVTIDTTIIITAYIYFHRLIWLLSDSGWFKIIRILPDKIYAKCLVLRIYNASRINEENSSSFSSV